MVAGTLNEVGRDLKILVTPIKRAMLLMIGSLLFFYPDTASAQEIVFSPDTLYMGKIPTSSRAVREQTAFNIQQPVLEITSIVIENDASGSFSILNNPGTASLGITQKVIVDIKFKPTSEGPLTADLVYTSNTTNEKTVVHLYGEGIYGSWTYFERVFGPLDGGGLSGIVQTEDEGYFLSGSTPNLDEEVSDIYLVKTDRRGRPTWTGRIANEDYHEGAGRILSVGNDEFILFGSRTRQSAVPRPDMQLLKINGSGDVAWAKTYGTNESETARDIISTADGGFLLLGTTDGFENSGNISKDIYLVKVDSAGVEQWSKTYGGDDGEIASKIISTTDGFLILASSNSWVVDSQDQDIYLVKIKSDGELEWAKTLGGELREGAADVAELLGGGYAVVGYSQVAGKGREMYLATIDATGEKVWDRYYGEDYQDGASNVLVADDGIIIAGSMQVLIVQSQSGSDQFEYSDIFVIKTDFDGNELWRYQHGGYKSEGASEMIFSAEGSIVIIGSSSSYYTDGSVFFLSFSPTGDWISSIRQSEATIPSGFHLNANYPNPFNNSTVISYDLIANNRVQINIYNIRGQKIRTLLDADRNIGPHSLGFDASGLSSRVYFYELRTAGGAEVKKMLLLK